MLGFALGALPSARASAVGRLGVLRPAIALVAVAAIIPQYVVLAAGSHLRNSQAAFRGERRATRHGRRHLRRRRSSRGLQVPISSSASSRRRRATTPTLPAWLDEAISRSRDDWNLWLVAARIETERGKIAAGPPRSRRGEAPQSNSFRAGVLSGDRRVPKLRCHRPIRVRPAVAALEAAGLSELDVSAAARSAASAEHLAADSASALYGPEPLLRRMLALADVLAIAAAAVVVGLLGKQLRRLAPPRPLRADLGRHGKARRSVRPRPPHAAPPHGGRAAVARRLDAEQHRAADAAAHAVPRARSERRRPRARLGDGARSRLRLPRGHARALAARDSAAARAHRRRRAARAGGGAQARAVPGHPREDHRADRELRHARRSASARSAAGSTGSSSPAASSRRTCSRRCCRSAVRMR